MRTYILVTFSVLALGTLLMLNDLNLVPHDCLHLKSVLLVFIIYN